jgi:hypothetical protein
MITFSKVKDSFIELGKRIIKVEEYGAKTAKSASSYGDDSRPLKNMTAIYAHTAVNSEQVIIGYINTNQIALEGEKRIFSQASNGDLSFAIHLKNNGTCEIGGNADNSVRFLPLKSGIDTKDALINAELVKIAAAINAIAPGSYTPASVSTDINSAKINEIKVL